jgi:hypothetical protein
MKRSTFALGAVLMGAAFAAGCAGAPPPAARVASSAAAIREAQELHAVETPAAQLRLQYALDEYAAGQQHMAAGQHETAGRLFELAEADAELAIAIAKQARSAKAAVVAIVEAQNVNTK